MFVEERKLRYHHPSQVVNHTVGLPPVSAYAPILHAPPIVPPHKNIFQAGLFCRVRRQRRCACVLLLQRHRSGRDCTRVYNSVNAVAEKTAESPGTDVALRAEEHFARVHAHDLGAQ